MTTTKPTLETCVELVRAAQTADVKARVIVCAQRHGYTLAQIRDELNRRDAQGGAKP